MSRLTGLLREDARMVRHDLLVNRMLGSALLPRLLRYGIFRALRLPVKGIMLPGVTIVGPLKNLTMGAESGINRRCFLDLSAQVTIGARTGIGMDCLIITSNHPIDEAGRWAIKSTPIPVWIGDDVWLGARVTVCPGAVIESNVVVAAGAVVTGRLASGGVYGGMPARRIGTHEITGRALA